ncbi:AAA family ATPase [Mesorhizobium sp. M0029]|uniref:AAA family ATPase n=1 Tax=Mesorhizobium sp. M0029 TaxID=2956850 RepID=UPI0033387D0A
MRQIEKSIRKWLTDEDMPEAESFYSALTTEGKAFTSEEGQYWDFKDQWPFSLSDEYFAGIARLICAFGNGLGGVIVFGVHDKKRDGGHNKVLINFDKFQQALGQLLGAHPNLVLKNYSSERYGDVNALLVCARQQNVSPYRFAKGIGKHKADTFWVRAGHEVSEATPSHFPILFCRADYEEFEGRSGVEGSLPPSPAVLKRFVGRTEVLDQLFHWLGSSDEPRTYLYGKGGSGKTTIAYEFAKLLKDHGQHLSISGHSIEVVIFLSAKEKELVPATGSVTDVVNIDFSSESELLRKILQYGNWTSDLESLATSQLTDLRSQLVQFLDLTSVVLILDDVDTLTTKGIDPGSDFLYRCLCRSKVPSRVIYTLRNSPTQSLTNSIEVPGLQDGEYELFVSECAAQFSVQEPSRAFRDNVLAAVSERRPLVVENIVALARTAGSYDRAVELFHQHAGDSIREYVFLREWEALTGGNLSKLFLAALADFDVPANFADLQTVLQFEPSRVKDAIGMVREMFLQVDEAGQEALFSLAPLTKLFVSSRKRHLEGYSVLRERIRAYKRTVEVSNPRVAAIATQVERLLPKRFPSHPPDRANEAYRIVTDKNLPPLVTENPVFKSTYAYVCVCLARPHLIEAREAFEYALKMRHEPDFRYMNRWFDAERNSGAHDGWTLKIADLVLNGRRYDEQDKVTMICLKATSLYARGKERLPTDTIDGLKDLNDALALHLRAFKLLHVAADYRAERYELFARNTAFQVCQILERSETPWELVDRVKLLGEEREIYLDPVEEPITNSLLIFAKTPYRPEIANRLRNRLRGLSEALSDPDKWLSSSALNRVKEGLAAAEKSLAARRP